MTSHDYFEIFEKKRIYNRRAFPRYMLVDCFGIYSALGNLTPSELQYMLHAAAAPFTNDP
jgi:hypothetical protein